MSGIKKVLFLIVAIGVTISCSDDDVFTIDSTDFPVNLSEVLASATINVNPTDVAPLTATIDLVLLSQWDITEVAIRVVGQDGPESDVNKIWSLVDTTIQIMVLGMYGGYENSVELTFLNANGFPKADTTIKIQTVPNISDMPVITTDVATSRNWGDEMTLVSYWGFDVDAFSQRPFIMDKFGKIRWYLDYSDTPGLNNFNYSNGMERLRNGNFFFATGNVFGATGGNSVYEIDMLGNVLNEWPLGNLVNHHEIIEKPNGNFLITVHEDGAATVEDIIIEVDRMSGAIINTIDLKESLDIDRQYLANDEVDWIHTNGISWDESDNTIILSGRTQAVVKITEDNEVVWILGSHRDWGLSGNGVDLNQYLLTPLDANDQEITDTSLLKAYTAFDDFEWPWFQHATKKNEAGNYTMFDNGTVRHFPGNGFNQYSRAVEYDIDDVNMTVKQIWDYGQDRLIELFSRFVSDVDYREDLGSVIMTSGGVQNVTNHAKVVEIDYASKNVIYEATITPPNAFFGVVSAHRSERLSLYPY